MYRDIKPIKHGDEITVEDLFETNPLEANEEPKIELLSKQEVIIKTGYVAPFFLSQMYRMGPTDGFIFYGVKCKFPMRLKDKGSMVSKPL